MKKVNALLYIILSILLITYPFIVYFGIQYFEPRYVGFLVLVLLLLRFWVMRQQIVWKNVKPLIPITIAGSALCLMIMLSNHLTMVRFYPVLINLVLLVVFVSTLIKPPSMIERLARLTNPNLSETAISYTRNVTIVWCSFFIFNATAAAITTFYTTLEVWTLYNGLIAYVLVGLIFIIEYAVRQFQMRSHSISDK
jgi:uncharacterized membrane protein